MLYNQFVPEDFFDLGIISVIGLLTALPLIILLIFSIKKMLQPLDDLDKAEIAFRCLYIGFAAGFVAAGLMLRQ